MYSIREANTSDSEQINAVSVHLGYNELLTAAAQFKLDQLLCSPHDYIYVIESKQIIVGWLHTFLARRIASPEFIEIGGIVVHPDFRRQGFAKALVSYVLANSTVRVRVRCSDKRTGSHKFYKAIGFELSKVQHVYES